MPFEYWDKLLFGIQRGECILFLGPELPLEAPDGARRMPVQGLAERLAGGPQRDDGGNASSPVGSLDRVAQRFLAREDEVGLEMEVTRWHQQLADQCSTLHEDLAALPFRLIVTISHDPLMEKALRDAGKTPHVERYHYQGSNQELLPEPTVQAPLLFYLYGHAAEPRSVVLTQTQLLGFLEALISRNPPLPNDLNAALTNGRLFLFLGFGLHRWYLRILLHVLKVLRPSSRSLVFENVEEGTAAVASDAILFYQENFRVDVHYDNVCEFARELHRRYVPPDEEPGDAGTSPLLAPSPAAQKIFICHANEDRQRAREIHDALKQTGLEPWLDKESLRGGDRWDALIESTIKGVDRFVVLNSQALQAKSQKTSYVNKEIKVALRAEDWRFKSFIIPVKIDDTPLLEPLDAYHAVDLTEHDGMRDLIRALKRQPGTV